MSNSRILRRPLNSVTQDLTPLIEDVETDEAISRPSTSSPASCPPICDADSSVELTADSSVELTADSLVELTASASAQDTVCFVQNSKKWRIKYQKKYLL